MRSGELPFELMDIYNRKILSNRAKLALMRVRRENIVTPRERAVFKRVSSLLQTACKGDDAISNSRMRATSEQSLLTLQETLTALRGKFKEPEAIRVILAELFNTTNELSEGRIPSPDTLKQLEEYLVRYNIMQSEKLREPRTSTSSEDKIWLSQQIGYSLTL